MKIACPHCSQHLELDPETITALEGASHFDCPTCGGAVEVPAPVLVPPKQTPATQTGKPIPERVARRTQQGINRNLLVLGVVALLSIGGVALFLASKNGGNIFNIFQNTTNQIINNSYFTQLIANGVTTKEDLESIAEIRPYGDGFIGVSKAALDWDQAQDLAKRTGAYILELDSEGLDSRVDLVTWLATNFKTQMSSPTWMLDQNAPTVLVNSEILALKTADGERKVLLRWRNIAEKLICIEGETFAFISKPSNGFTKFQNLGPDFSGNKHLWWSEGKPGDLLTLQLDQKDLFPGVYDIAVYPTSGPDYAIIKVMIDGQERISDRFSERGVHPGPPLRFKGVVIKPDNLLRVDINIVDRNKRAFRHYRVGIDRIELHPNSGEDRTRQ